MITLRRKYNFNDSKLWAISNRMLIGVRRDISEFAAFGLDQSLIDALKAQSDAYSNLPTDVELNQAKAHATQNKKLHRSQLTQFLRTIILARVALKFGIDSPVYGSFGAQELYNTTDIEFYFAARKIKRKAQFYFSDLATVGLTASHLRQADAEIEQFFNAIAAQEDAIEERENAVYIRVESGNALFDALCEISALGKRLWNGVDPRKYKSYILVSKLKSAEII